MISAEQIGLHSQKKILTPSPMERTEVVYKKGRGLVFVKRDDRIHPLVSGNKWRKLKYHPCFSDTISGGSQILTMGGGYSNLVLALASLCHSRNYMLKVLTTHRGPDTYLMKWCKRLGTTFQTLSRTEMRKLRSGELNPNEWVDTPGKFHWIPEGGGGEWSRGGLAEMVGEIQAELSGQKIQLLMGAGTGISTVFTAMFLTSDSHLWAFPAIRSRSFNEYLLKEIGAVRPGEKNFNLLVSDEDRGMGWVSESLIEFLYDYYVQSGVLLDPFYNGKALYYGLKRDGILDGPPIVLVHSGGTQAWLGLREKYPKNEKVLALSRAAGEQLQSNSG